MTARTLRIELGARAYPIRIGHKLLGDAASYPELRGRPLRLVTDRHVAVHYLTPLRRALALDEPHCLVLEPGESQKTFDNAGRVVDWLLGSRLPRDGVVVALGGGVIGDLAGFCASICQRGVDFVQVPTTLLAQVDSSVGGKTGVNHPQGKNLIGAFHQPVAVVADLETLKTLPRRELLAGLAEVIKYGMLGDVAFFGWLEQHLDELLALGPTALTSAVEKCCQMKANIVVEDELESGPRALLNLGHTFAHAIEAHTGFDAWLHGEAVAVGLCMAADLSARLGWIDAADAVRCRALVERIGLPSKPPAGLAPARFLELMGHDKKVQDGKLRLVLLRAIGRAVVTADFDADALRATLAAAA
ncbi:MAG TPA: 3-dehydroquinate synthase [Verrucomicrobiae bacterium]|nr:3-dehydroquinate synthase [Verrucomicrobiae bacterium]